MKKTILVAAFLLAISNNIQAQLVKFGAKAGLNYANQSGTIDGYNKDAISSYHAGLIADIQLVKGFSVQPELLYSTQGASYDNAVEEFKNELGYISIPVIAKIHFNESVSLDFGPQASFLLSKRNEFDANDPKTFEFGAAGGLTFNITKNLFVQGRYVLGLTEASKNAEVKNTLFQLSTGFSF